MKNDRFAHTEQNGHFILDYKPIFAFHYLKVIVQTIIK
jgi:hypothetical protein